MFKHNWAWIKLATDNFSTVLTRNLRNPRDYAPLRPKFTCRNTGHISYMITSISLVKLVRRPFGFVLVYSSSYSLKWQTRKRIPYFDFTLI